MIIPFAVPLDDLVSKSDQSLLDNKIYGMSNQLNILITGATSGFGRQTAETLANDGHQVFATARGVNGKNADAAQSLEKWASERELNLKVVELDVSDDASVNQGISSILKDAGHLDVVINNAGNEAQVVAQRQHLDALGLGEWNNQKGV